MATGGPLRSLTGCVVALLLPVAASAAPSAAATLVQRAILAKTPANWQVHVSDRGDFLDVFVTPPYQEAFDLLYQPEELRNRMLAPASEATGGVVVQALASRERRRLRPGPFTRGAGE